MPELVDAVWEGASYGSRRDRKPFRYQAFVPDPIAEWDTPLALGAADAVSRATVALAELNAGEAGHDLEALAGPLLRAEALGSSFIEGLRASHKRVALARFEPVAADGTARAVLGNVRAMERAVELGAGSTSFRLDDLVEIHRVLLEGTSEDRYAGRVREQQNWVGGRGVSPVDAVFIPPPPDRVHGLLADLVEFVNLDDVPPVVQAAVAHAQFETIHPFGDGNGRTGRCLVHVVLRRRGLAQRFVPPVSVILANDARRYVAGLVDFREGRNDDWIGHFADSLSASAAAARRLSGDLDELLASLLDRAGSPSRGSVARKVILGLPAQSVVSAETVAERYGVTPTAARTALNRLEEAGVLVTTRVGRRRGREWISDELFQLLDQFEYDNAAPPEGRGRRRAPAVTKR